MAFYSFVDDDGGEYGSFEVFEMDEQDCRARFEEDLDNDPDSCDVVEYKPGFYWWACFPGCMPDGDPVGPFSSEDEAVKDAQMQE